MISSDQGPKRTRRCTEPRLLACGSHQEDDSDLQQRIDVNAALRVDGLRPLAVVPDCLKKMLDKWPRETVERLVTQSGVLRYARSANLIKRTRDYKKEKKSQERTISAARRHFSRAISWVDP